MPNLVAFHGSATVRSSDYRIQADPNNTIVPMSRVKAEAGAVRNLPSVVVDFARSESSQDVGHKAQLWFHMSEGAIKVVLFVIVSGSPPQITISKWMQDRVAAGGPMTQSRATEQQFFKGHCVQAIRVEPNSELTPRDLKRPDLDPDDFNVTAESGSPPLPMVLELDLVCNRPPSSPVEGDFTFDKQLFQKFASEAWPFCG